MSSRSISEKLLKDRFGSRFAGIDASAGAAPAKNDSPLLQAACLRHLSRNGNAQRRQARKLASGGELRHTTP